MVCANASFLGAKEEYVCDVTLCHVAKAQAGEHGKLKLKFY